MPTLADYEPIIGGSAIDELREVAARLMDRHIVMVNSTRSGGGVAEILARMMPLLKELGLRARWEVIEGTEAFYRVTKKFHNALHGRPEAITEEMFRLFAATGEQNAARLDLQGDLIVIHDPQPIPLVETRAAHPSAKWIWRCHIDVSNPQPDVWNFLKPFILKFDAAVYSAAPFVQRMAMRQLLIAPSIDPLSEKNRELSPEEIAVVLGKLGVPQDEPIVTQVSRFDYLKDPLGVITAFRRVRRSVKCRLVLAGGPATDDPESDEVLHRAQEEAHGDPEIHLLMLPPNSDVEINALQRASAVVVQKSIREGFGLTVAEALWKGRPVAASAVGGIPLQVKHRYSGLLVHSIEGTVQAVKQLLNNPDYARRLGENGREHVRQNFLLTRHLQDYLLLFLLAGSSEDVVSLASRP
ncbi:MAG: glycosyltransferase [Candidatus Omnitrophica bacterium]|nr:glycosyltransferase [Candidatus Omnitrophota bacterium]